MPDAVKAANYIQQLDDARCDENWDAVPELIRKVRKHAPDRVCLTLTAEIEHSLAKSNFKHTPATDSTARPPTASIAPAGHEASNRLPDLLTAIDAEANHPEDRFQARVCAGWLLWVLHEYPAALARLPRTLLDQQESVVSSDNDGTGTGTGTDQDRGSSSVAAYRPSSWTKVCGLKAAYLRANCLARDGQREGALQAFETALPTLSDVWAAGAASPPTRQQTRFWAELFLTEFCMLNAQALREGSRALGDQGCLAGFRTWAKFWLPSQQQAGVVTDWTAIGGYGFRGSVPRRQVWREYYFALSEILQGDLPYPAGYVAVGQNSKEKQTLSTRNKLAQEVVDIQAAYGRLLLDETKFPRADEERADVEEFVRRLMQNFEILNGSGGRKDVLLGRFVKDTLYEAAAKTYHSTTILRYMFTAHLAAAQFNMAFRAADSWLELVKKGRARVQKTGHREPALDDDATTLTTLSACITALCRFGGRDEAEKAYKLAEELEELVLEEEDKQKTKSGDYDDSREVPGDVLALAWQSVGQAKAHWARTTYDAESRPGLQEKATQCLVRSLSPRYRRPVDPKGVFALAVLYAEQRKLSAAIDLVKSTLLGDKPLTTNQQLRLGPYYRERALIPLWHLLALLLSARQEYVLAARACEGAIEQFKDPYVLFGSRHLAGPGGYRSEHLKEAAAKGSDDGKAGGDGLVDEMDEFEKEGILQIKITQLAILEVVEGPAVAVNASTELITLFTRLFGNLDQEVELARVEPPKTAATTAGHSLRGSIFGSKHQHHPRQSVTTTGEAATTSSPPRPQTTQTTQTTQTGQSSPTDVNPNEPVKRTRNSLRKRTRSVSRPRAASGAGSVGVAGPPVPPLDSAKYSAAFDAGALPSYGSGTPTGRSSAQSQTQGQTQSRAGTTNGTSAGTDSATATPPRQIAGLASPLLPFVTFPERRQQLRRNAILVRVWLVIAGFYRRAGLLDDAEKAMGEAERAVGGDGEGILEGSTEGHGKGGVVTGDDVDGEGGLGLGFGMGVDEARADVQVEKGRTLLARGKKFAARREFEIALTLCPDHPAAIVELSNQLLDIYTEHMIPIPVAPELYLQNLALDEAGNMVPVAADPDETDAGLRTGPIPRHKKSAIPPLPSTPLGLFKKEGVTSVSAPAHDNHPPSHETTNGHAPSLSTAPSLVPSLQPLPEPINPRSNFLGPPLTPPAKTTTLPLLDRLAARDRAYGLLSALTRLGSGWDDAEAWLALGRAYEESGQVDKARGALWWCVELEDGRGVRGWGVAGGYVL
ncbi:hypothetical protein B0J18DRAFT_490939 [Chaetomium sp. MPI-SDFR-AT-0129]|nr:hypothetical protein B0J18DRAFT_490939 [Chaetomium sp. MPI-SDFR-AT-0129]